MASALQPALQPALSGSDWAIGQDTGAQQVGAEGRDKADVGIALQEPDWSEGPLLQGPEFNTAPSLYTGLDYLDAEYQGDYPDHTPWPSNDGDPDRPADLDTCDNLTAMAGHDWDSGNPAAIRFSGNPDIGKPVLQQFSTQSTEQQPVFSPNGEMVETPGTREAPGFNNYNDQDINVGIGYYVQEDERPLYNQLAQVPAEYDGPGGLYQPDNRYSSWVYNDGGIPPAYVTPPDPPVSQMPAQPSVPDDYYGSY